MICIFWVVPDCGLPAELGSGSSLSSLHLPQWAAVKLIPPVEYHVQDAALIFSYRE